MLEGRQLHFFQRRGLPGPQQYSYWQPIHPSISRLKTGVMMWALWRFRRFLDSASYIPAVRSRVESRKMEEDRPPTPDILLKSTQSREAPRPAWAPARNCVPSSLPLYTPETNMEPDTDPFKKDSSLQRALFRVSCQCSRLQILHLLQKISVLYIIYTYVNIYIYNLYTLYIYIDIYIYEYTHIQNRHSNRKCLRPLRALDREASKKYQVTTASVANKMTTWDANIPKGSM